MKHFNITFKPDDRRISIHAGAMLLEAAGQAGIILNAVCGGKGTCKKCMVNLAPDGRAVLACLYRIDSDLTVTIPPSSRLFEHKILTEGITPQTEIRPDIYEKYPAGKILGVAVDIGTTTVVAKLIDMTDGKILAIEAELNPQTRFGDDSISRINYAQTDAKLTELHKIIIDCINGLTAKLCSRASIDAEQIYEMCVVGNTTMNHIFLKLPVVQLGQAPYKAFSLDAKDLSPEKIALQMNHTGNVHTVENIAGFVGSDTTAVALAVDISSANEMTLVVDIGTNGEIVLGNKDKLCAASCAAGPAFEGARISSGSRAVDGAIEAVVINDGDIDLDVIGNCPPRSICGSGLIDAVAVLLDLGVIDPTGRFTKPNELSPAIAARLIQQDNQPAFCLYRAANVSERSLFLTQKDIRELQLAKAAIRAGIKLLQKKAGIKDDDIKQVLLAGAFGNYIRRESALRIGLLPRIPIERIKFIGNAAASGAEMLLVSSQCRAQAKKLARKIEYLEIAHQPDFQTVFAESMSF
ncbi:MAG: ASKHA domain-containing protein [Phycisphaerae bacterium]|nr:ASKHA domain-containing protein [Phycisphaerae bacterium]